MFLFLFAAVMDLCNFIVWRRRELNGSAFQYAELHVLIYCFHYFLAKPSLR